MYVLCLRKCSPVDALCAFVWDNVHLMQEKPYLGLHG